MEELDHRITDSFLKLLENLVDGETYRDLPPKAVEDVLSPSTEEQLALEQNIWGEDETGSDSSITSEIRVIETLRSKKVLFPTGDKLSDLNVMGIHGDNARIITSSFHLILARATLVNFKYTNGIEKPYFYQRRRESTAMTVLDNNIFQDGFKVFTNHRLEKKDGGSTPIWDLLDQNSQTSKRPFLFRYDHEKTKKSPNSQSLGLAVKFQHTLELTCVQEIDLPKQGLTVCIKNGALFSNSTSTTDNKSGLKELLPWAKEGDKIFVAAYGKVSDSRLFLKTLIANPDLIERYFPGQGITQRMINSFGSDALILKKVIPPGHRSPFVEFIEPTRVGAISEPGMEGLVPITCFYHKKSKPHSFLRIEIPKMFWENNPEQVEFAISVVAWQHELGGGFPLVLQAAKEQSSLSHDRMILEQQMHSAFNQRDLELIEFNQ
ncbi:MAG: DNA double-strand break repair nuclease NurA [Cyclobacteriaceae bacterium]